MSVSEPQDSVRARLDAMAVVLHRFEKKITEAQQEVADELLLVMGKGSKSTPTVTVDGRQIPMGTITRTQPTLGIRITDRAAYLAWARENYPEHVRWTVPPPVPKFVPREVVDEGLDKQLTIDAIGRVRGPNNEMDIPGVEVAEKSKSYITVKSDGDVIDLAWPEVQALVGSQLMDALELEAGVYPHGSIERYELAGCRCVACLAARAYAGGEVIDADPERCQVCGDEFNLGDHSTCESQTVIT